MSKIYGYNVFIFNENNELLNHKYKIKSDVQKTHHLTWTKAISLFSDPKEILKDKESLQFLRDKKNKTDNIVLVKIEVVKENIYDCRSYRIEEITPWTRELEEEFQKEMKIEQEQRLVEYKSELNKEILANQDRYSDPSFIFTSFDLRPIESLENLKNSVQKAYEGMTWNGFYDGSRSEAMDDGENKNRIEILYHLGRKLGMKLVDLPDFDSDDHMEWNGKCGLIEIKENE